MKTIHCNLRLLILLPFLLFHGMLFAGPESSKNSKLTNTAQQMSNERSVDVDTLVDEKQRGVEDSLAKSDSVENDSLLEAEDGAQESTLADTIISIVILIIFIVIIIAIIVAIVSAIVGGAAATISTFALAVFVNIAIWAIVIALSILRRKSIKETRKAFHWRKHKIDELSLETKRFCKWCNTEATGDELTCLPCGGPVHDVKPHVVTCGWCGSHNAVFAWDELKCLTCHGEIASPIPGDPGPQPIDPDRKIPKEFVNTVLYWQNNEMKIGLFLVVIFCWAGFPILIGIPYIYKGWKTGQRRKRSYEKGEAFLAKVTSIVCVEDLQSNGVRPRRVTYEYEINGEQYKADDLASSEQPLPFSEGEKVWIVADPKDRNISAIWPPIV